MVEDTRGGGESHDVPDIAALLIAYRDRTGQSYDDMERRTGDVIKSARLHNMVREPQRNFPEPRTLEALASLLQLPVATVVLAFARTLGLPVTDRSTRLAQSLPPGTDELTDEDRDAILAVTRQLIQARRAAPAFDLSRVEGLRLAEEATREEVRGNDLQGR